MKVDILAVGVHPDDVELGCSGTLLKHIAMGKTIGLLDLTQGELGTRGNQEIRKKEAENALKKLGATFRKNLALPDGFFNISRENTLKIIEVIRWCQPDIVLANSIKDRHPDHGRSAKLVSEAAFYSGLAKIETADAGGNRQSKWRPRALYHYIQDMSIEPDFVIDITPFFRKKIELVQTFSSQFFIPGENPDDPEMQTPISGQDFLEFLEAKARTFGRPLGVEFAEGFIADRIPGVRSLFDLE
jgi:bacillithiol biosynthesis deacetylase BshB1